MARAAGFFVLVLMAVWVTFAGAPDSTRADITAARAIADQNEELASGAPQQQVVNGWEAADLLDVIATRSVDNRTPQLLLILIMAVSWGAATSTWTRARESPRTRAELSQQE